MDNSHPLTDRLLACLPEEQRHRAEVSTEVEDILRSSFELATARFPGVALNPETLLPKLAQRLEHVADLAEQLSELHLEDLFLACACVQGDLAAIAVLESDFLGSVESALSRLKLGPAMREEVAQSMREQLLVGEGKGLPPMLLAYSGSGQLRNWLRIIAVRSAGKLLDQGKREVLLTNSVLSGLSPATDDPELAFLKRTYRAQFQQALDEGLESLSSRDRNLLAQRYVDRLNIDEIAIVYSVHRATAARWLSRARDSLLGSTRKCLMNRIHVDRKEYESIMRLIESQLPETLIDELGERRD